MVVTGGSEWHQINRGVATYMSLYLALFAGVILLSKFLHDRPALSGVLPEAAMIIMLGILAGWVIYLFDGGDEYEDDEEEVEEDDKGEATHTSPLTPASKAACVASSYWNDMVL